MPGIKRKAIWWQWLRCWQLWVMLLPAILYILLFVYKPMYGIQIAFKDYRMRMGFAGSEWVGLKHFVRLFQSYWFPIIIKNTLLISGLSLLIGFPAPIVLSLMVNEVPNAKAQRVFQTISYAPHFITTVVICGMINLFLSQSNGIVNKFIEALGGEAQNFMQSPSAFKWIYVLTGVWQGVGWSSIIYVASLSGIDLSQLEAAQIDGANRLQKILHINLPHIVPTIIILLILQCGSILSVGYEKVYLLQTMPNLQGSEIISTYVYKMGLEKSDFSFSTAVGLLNSVCNTAFLVITNAISRKLTDTSLF